MTKLGSLILCLIQFVVNETLVYGNFCEADNDCVSTYRPFCCRNEPFLSRKRCRANCIGQYCTSDADCRHDNECCGILNRCTTYGCRSECKTNADCKSGTYCCRKRDITEKSVCLSKCVGEYCRSDTDCGGKRECCSRLNHCTTHGCRHECLSSRDCSNNTVCCVKGHDFDKNSCKATCLSESCKSDQDCGRIGLCCGSDHFCTDKCNTKSKRFGGWIIATIVTSVGFAVLLVSVLGFFFVRRQRQKPPVRNSVVVIQPPVMKDPTLPANSKPQNSYRRPPPLPPPQTRNSPPPQTRNLPPSPDKKLSSKKPPCVQPKLHQNVSPPFKTLGKERRKPPSPPATKPNGVQRDLTPRKYKPPPPRPPGLPQNKEQWATNSAVTSRTLSKERRLPPLPPP